MEQLVDLFGYQLTKHQYDNITANEQELQQFLQIISQKINQKGPEYFQKIRIQLKSQLQSFQQLIRVEEYAFQKLSNKQLKQGYTDVSKQYPYLIKVRGDGNCFYRAAMIGILISIIQKNKNELFRILIRQIQQTDKFVYQLKDEQMSIQETDIGLILVKFFTQILIQKTINNKFSILQLLAEINDFPEIDLSLIIFCRNFVHKYFEKSLKDPQYNQFIGDDMKTKIPFSLCVIGEQAEDVIIPISADVFFKKIKYSNLLILSLIIKAFSYNIVIQNLYIDKNDKLYTDQIQYKPNIGNPFDTIILCYTQSHFDLLLSSDQSQIFQNYPQIQLNSKFILKIMNSQRILKDELIDKELEQDEIEKEKKSQLCKYYQFINVIQLHQLYKDDYENGIGNYENNKQHQSISQKKVDKCKKQIQKGGKNKEKEEKENHRESSNQNDEYYSEKKQKSEKKKLSFYQRLKSFKKCFESKQESKEEQKWKCLECQKEFISNQEEEMSKAFLCDNCYQLQSNQLSIIRQDNDKKKSNIESQRVCNLCESELELDENFHSDDICKQCIKIQLLTNYKQNDCISCKKEAQIKIESPIYNDFQLGICYECVRENFILFKDQQKLDTLRVFLKGLQAYIVFNVNEEISKQINMYQSGIASIEQDKNQPSCFFCMESGDQFLYETANPQIQICINCFKSQEYRQIKDSAQDEQIQNILWQIINQLNVSTCFICFDPIDEESKDDIKVQDIIRESSIQICLKCQKEGIIVFDQDQNISAFSSYLNHPLNIILKEEDQQQLKQLFQSILN